ncbi:MAG: GNAT family N-acetyltransferase [Octadecabacter sp.]
MTPNGLAQTHAAAFGGKGWPVADFERYLGDTSILIHGDETCFAVFRCIGPEAEILTLATAPANQRTGKATAMLRSAIAVLAARNVDTVFLDVAADNAAAIALYTGAGFVAFSSRANYYANGASAICMKAVLYAASAS